MPKRITAAIVAGIAVAAGIALAYQGDGESTVSPTTPGTIEAASSDAAVALSLPVDCTPGESCFIQSYADRDPGPGARDYRCEGQSYPDHQGTDFRIPDLAAAAQIRVLAAASGTVTRLRDGVRDHDPRAIAPASTGGMDCGNGVAIDHGDGWETQYCHMRRGSIRVAEGDAVSTGDPIGIVGLTGNTEFAHLHITVRHNGRIVDPFAPGDMAECGAGGPSLWSAEAARQLGYRRSSVLNTGFAAAPIEMADIEAGGIARPAANSPALLAYARLINLREGDRFTLRLIGPDGAVLAENTTEPMDRHKAQYMLFTGRRLREQRWPAGRYRGEIRVENEGRRVLEQSFDIRL